MISLFFNLSPNLASSKNELCAFNHETYYINEFFEDIRYIFSREYKWFAVFPLKALKLIIELYTSINKIMLENIANHKLDASISKSIQNQIAYWANYNLEKRLPFIVRLTRLKELTKGINKMRCSIS